MNRAESAGNCGADPHFASRHSLSNAAIEVLENRCLLSQTVVYSYNGPDYTAAPGVTANWYSTPENSVGGNTLKGLNGNTSRPLVLNNLPSHSTISIAFDLVTTGTFSGGNFAVVQRTVGPGPTYTVTNTTRLSDTISHSGSGVTYTRYRVEFAQSDNRLDLQFNMSGVPHNPGSWGIDNVSIVNDRETPEVSIAATTPTTTEGSSTGAVFTVTRTTADEALDVIVRVPQTVQGTNGLAAPGADYSTNPVQDNGDILVQFARNETSKTIVVTAGADALVEGDESVSASLYIDSEDGSYAIGTASNAQINIADAVGVTVEGLYVVDTSTNYVSFTFSRDLEVFDGEIVLEFETFVDTLTELGATLPDGIVIPANVASVQLNLSLDVGAIDQAAAWYFYPIPSAIFPVAILGTLMGVQVAPTNQYNYETFRQKLSSEFTDQGSINLGGAKDKSNQENEPLTLKSLRWTGAQMIDMGAVAFNLGVDVMFASVNVMGKLKLLNPTINKLLGAAETVAKHEEKLRNALRTLVDRDYLYETSTREITLDNKRYFTEVTWLIDKATKVVALGETRGAVPNRTTAGGGVGMPFTTNTPIPYHFAFEGAVRYDGQQQLTGVNVGAITVQEGN